MSLEVLKEEGLKSAETDDDFELTENQKEMLDSHMNDIVTGKVQTITAEASDARIRLKYGF